MTFCTVTLRATAVGLLVCSFALIAAASTFERWPAFEGETLAGTRAKLPSAEAGETTLLIATFDKQGQDAAQAWRTRIDVELSGTSRMRVYTVAFLDSMPGFVRRMVVSGIRRGVPSALHSRFVIVDSDDPAWKQRFNYGRAQDAYLMLMDHDGTVRWQFGGTVNDAAISALRAAMVAMPR